MIIAVIENGDRWRNLRCEHHFRQQIPCSRFPGVYLRIITWYEIGRASVESHIVSADLDLVRNSQFHKLTTFGFRDNSLLHRVGE